MNQLNDIDLQKAMTLIGLIEKGVTIRPDQMHWLRANNYIGPGDSTTFGSVSDSSAQLTLEAPELTLEKVLSMEDIPQDMLDKFLANLGEEGMVAGEIEEDYAVTNGRKANLYGVNGISKKDWYMPREEVMYYSDDFWNWINAINSDFRLVHPDNPNRIKYEPFEKYRQQAIDMLSEPVLFNPLAPKEERKSVLRMERKRCLESSLYGLNKHLKLKEGEGEQGTIDYSAWYLQQIVLFIFDQYLCPFIGKPRQVGLTSTIGGAAGLRTMLRASYFTKFITEKGEKGYEIFEDKVKHAIYHYPDYLVPSISNESQDLLRFIFKPAKGRASGPDSKFKVEPPTASAINGGTPSCVLLDEIGFIDILGDIINQGRPTMFKYDPQMNRLRLTRQCVAWGTGGYMDKGGGAMELEWKMLKEAWLDKDFRQVFIPMFFNAFAKPGVDEKFLKSQQAAYYSKGTEQSKIDFHQTYPVTEEDMFLRSSETLLPVADISNHVYKSRAYCKDKAVWGYFQPIFDESKPRDELSDVPYKIIGSEFIPVDDDNHEMKMVCMIRPPESGWVDRYYEGTDPIATSTGHSKFASSIWDAHTNSISCYLNWRMRPDEDHRFVYMQAMLLGMHYRVANHLCEANIGRNFFDYMDGHGMAHVLMGTRQLPQHIRTQASLIGIKKQSHNTKYIIGYLLQCIHDFGENIKAVDFWIQLKTFVKKVTTAGNESWQPENRKIYYDDLVDSVSYAYLARMCFPHAAPYRQEIDDTGMPKKKALRYKIVNGHVETFRGRRILSSRGSTIGGLNRGRNR